MKKNLFIVILILLAVSCSPATSPNANNISGSMYNPSETTREDIEKYGINISQDDNVISKELQNNMTKLYNEKGFYKVIFVGTPKNYEENGNNSLAILTVKAAKDINVKNVYIDISNIEFQNNTIGAFMFSGEYIEGADNIVLKFIFPKDKIKVISSMAFTSLYYIKEITLPDSVTAIENEAFQQCSYLEKLTLGNNVKTIGNMAFLYAESLKELTIPNSVDSIGMGAFGNSGLQKVTIPASVKSIDYGAFTTSPNLSTVIYLGDSPDIIKDGGDVLSYCTKLTTLKIPNAKNINDDRWRTFLSGNFKNITK